MSGVWGANRLVADSDPPLSVSCSAFPGLRFPLASSALAPLSRQITLCSWTAGYVYEEGRFLRVKPEQDSGRKSSSDAMRCGITHSTN